LSRNVGSLVSHHSLAGDHALRNYTYLHTSTLQILSMLLCLLFVSFVVSAGTLTVDAHELYYETGRSISVTIETNLSPGVMFTKTSRVVPEDQSVTLTAPEEVDGSFGSIDYIFVRWIGDVTSSSRTITFTMRGDMTVDAIYREPVDYTLSVSSLPTEGMTVSGGGVTPYTVTYQERREIALTAMETFDGRPFASWTGSVTSSERGISFTMDGNKSLTANYGVLPTLTVNSAGASAVKITSTTGHGGSTNYTKTTAINADVSLSAPLSLAGKLFTGWTGAVSSGSQTISLTMSGDKTVTANYVQAYTLAVNSTGASGVPITSTTNHGGSTNYTKSLTADTAVSLFAPADFAGKQFTGWTGSVSIENQTISLTISGDTTLIANYLGSYTLNVSSSGASNVPIESSTGHDGTTNYTKTIDEGIHVSLAAPTTWDGRHFVGWSGAVSSSDQTISFSMDVGKSVTANYAIMHTLLVNSSGASNVPIASSTGHSGTTNYMLQVAEGTNVSLSAPATASGMNFADWSGYITSGNRGISFPMTQNMDVTCRFAAPRETGTVIVDVNPDSVSWSFLDGDGDKHAGSGDATVESVPTGLIELTWPYIPLHDGPTPNPETKTLSKDGVVTFIGIFTRQAGTVEVRVAPDTASWSFLDSEGNSYSRTGNQTVEVVPTGEVELTWGALENFDLPMPNPTAQVLSQRETIVFEGIYLPFPVISGAIRDADATPIPDVTVAWDGQTTMVTTDECGNYKILVPRGWSGRVTPSMPDAKFSPPYREYTDVTEDLANQDFTTLRWVEATADLGFTGRIAHAVLAHDGYLWVVGGCDSIGYRNDVWRSEDGLLWTEVIRNAPWTARGDHTVVSFQGEIFILGGNDGARLNDVWRSSDGVVWTRVIEHADWSERDGHISVNHDGLLWVLGGVNASGGLQDVWNSNNGSEWCEVTGAAPWPARSHHAGTVHDNQIWVLGGLAEDAKLNDVWRSNDGFFWQNLTGGAPWANRAKHTVSLFGDEMWLIGGEDNANANLNDVWHSADGLVWTPIETPVPWLPRNGHGASVHSGALCLIGGENNAGRSRDVWTTLDGVEWVEQTKRAPWTPRCLQDVLIHDGQMWIMGGHDADTMSNDAWHSANGWEWTKAAEHTPWSERFGHSTLVHDGSIWVLGGSNGKANLGDVWSSPDGSLWTQDSPSPGWAPRAGE